MFSKKEMSFMYDQSIPISLLRQFLFCKRIPFFTEVMGIKPASPSWTRTGTKFHKNQINLSKQRTFKRFDLEDGKYHFNLHLKSEVIGIHGICDILIETPDEVVPVEIKMNRKISEPVLLQLLGQGIVAEECFNKKFQIAFVMDSIYGKTKMIEIGPDERNFFFQSLDKLKETIDHGVLPNSDASIQKCVQCEFLNFCNDRDI